jgi:hypothetical protein
MVRLWNLKNPAIGCFLGEDVLRTVVHEVVVRGLQDEGIGAEELVLVGKLHLSSHGGEDPVVGHTAGDDRRVSAVNIPEGDRAVYIGKRSVQYLYPEKV